MSIAIRTKYLPVTNHKGSRISARPMLSNPGVLHVRSVTVGMYDLEATGTFEKHAEVAKMLAERLKWVGAWHAGDDGAGGWVYVRSSLAHRKGAAFVVEPVSVSPRIYGAVIVKGKTYEDDEIAMLVGRDVTGWRWGGDVTKEEGNIAFADGPSIGIAEGGLPAALAYIKGK